MITAILIILILSQVISLALIIQIGKNQETNFQIFSKVQDDQWDEIIQIGRTARAIDRKIEDSTIYKTKFRFVDKKKD